MINMKEVVAFFKIETLMPKVERLEEITKRICEEKFIFYRVGC